MNKQKIKDYIALTRLNRPIGFYLVLWPALWSLWLAAEGTPSNKNLIIFIVGALLMRSAGCVINDFADRNFDGHVERTKHRPMATGKVGKKEALILFAALCAVAFVLVLFTNVFTILLSFVAVALAACYPFMKRHTHLPQVVLGAAFGWAIPMAFTAEINTLPATAWLVFTTALIWTVAYDTMYAMADREDDIKIGVKSTAILFGENDRLIVGILQVLTILGFFAVGARFELSTAFHCSVIMAALIFVYQQYLIKDRDPKKCFTAFLNNNWVGIVIFIGVALDYWLKR